MVLAQKQRLFQTEYKTLFAFLYRFISFRVPQPQDAEDIVSDTLITAYDLLSAFDPDRGNLSQWATGIAKNKMKQYWRTRGRLQLLEEGSDIEQFAGSEKFNIDAFDASVDVTKLFASLTKEQQALLTFRYVDDLTYEEIADVLGKQPAAIRKTFSRLHATLRTRATTL